MSKNREALLAEVRRRWRGRDSTPLIPRFDAEVARQLAGARQSGWGRGFTRRGCGRSVL